MIMRGLSNMFYARNFRDSRSLFVLSIISILATYPIGFREWRRSLKKRRLQFRLSLAVQSSILRLCFLKKQRGCSISRKLKAITSRITKNTPNFSIRWPRGMLSGTLLLRLLERMTRPPLPMIKLLINFWAFIASFWAHVVTKFLLIPPFSAQVL